MKSRELLFCLAASLFALPGCQSAPRRAAESPSVAAVTLELRSHRITLHVGYDDTRYSVATSDGEVLAQLATRAELKASQPELYELVRSAIVLAQQAMVL